MFPIHSNSKFLFIFLSKCAQLERIHTGFLFYFYFLLLTAGVSRLNLQIWATVIHRLYHVTNLCSLSKCYIQYLHIYLHVFSPCSSSYSTAALEFEKEHQINPVYDSPRMSRRSLRLQTSSGFYDDNSLTERTGIHNVSSYKQASSSTSSSVSRSDLHLSVGVS